MSEIWIFAARSYEISRKGKFVVLGDILWNFLQYYTIGYTIEFCWDFEFRSWHIHAIFPQIFPLFGDVSIINCDTKSVSPPLFGNVLRLEIYSIWNIEIWIIGLDRFKLLFLVFKGCWWHVFDLLCNIFTGK